MLEEAIRYNTAKQGELEVICSPLEKFFGVKLIHYRRFYLTGGMISLYTHSEWMDFSIKNRYWHSTVLYEKLKNLQYKNTLIYLWPSEPLNDAVYQGLYHHNLWNGITIYKKHGDCIESYAFATTKENIKMMNIYLSEIDVLEHFILYFKSKIFHSLTSSVEKEIMLPFSYDFPSEDERDATQKKFLEDTPVDNLYLRIKGTDIKLTKREKDCLTLLSSGKTAKEIANLLELSSRTIETYLENLRIKTGAISASQLIHIYHENGY